MADSIVMRSKIESRIREVEEFKKEATSEKLDLASRRRMMLNLGIRHGVYGSSLVSETFFELMKTIFPTYTKPC